MDVDAARRTLRYADWDELLVMEDGETFAVKVDGEPTLATKVYSEDKEDSDEDRDLTVVVEIRGQYFRRKGWGGVGSHCYGDYEISWGELAEVFPHEKTITCYEEAE